MQSTRSAQLPVEIWHMIMTYLAPWDALQLRTASFDFYVIITTHQRYWYQHFCWFLICQKKRPAMFKTGCHKTHNPNIPRDIACLNIEQEQELITQYCISLSELPALLAANPDMTSKYECNNIDHYIYDLPLHWFEIPIDPHDYQPNEQIYCYRFLIHNYRNQRQRTSRYNRNDIKRQMKQVREDLVRQQKELNRLIKQCERDIEKSQNRDLFLHNIDLQLARIEHNKIFHGKKSRQYKGMLDTISERK